MKDFVFWCHNMLNIRIKYFDFMEKVKGDE